MQIKADNPEEYISQLSGEKKEAIVELRNVIKKRIPNGFVETMSYGMIGYVVPHAIYPDGYHCDPKLPLPFINLAAQKNYVAVYHMAIYSDPGLMEWFVTEYPKYSAKKPDMGKSCIRFKNANDIPYQLIGELAGKITPAGWIKKYEDSVKKK